MISHFFTKKATTVTPASTEAKVAMEVDTLTKENDENEVKIFQKEDDHIDRLIAQPSPVVDVVEMQNLPSYPDPDISSFYISPASTTNHSLFESLSHSQDTRRSDGDPSVAALPKGVQSLIMSVMASEQPAYSPRYFSEAPSSPTKGGNDSDANFAGIADESFRTLLENPAEEMLRTPTRSNEPTPQPLPTSQTSHPSDAMEADDGDCDISRNLNESLIAEETRRRPVRARKAVVAFDPTPATKPRRTRAKKDSTAAAVDASMPMDSSKEGMSAVTPNVEEEGEGKLSISEEIAMVLSEDLNDDLNNKALSKSKKPSKKKEAPVLVEDKDLAELVQSVEDGDFKVRMVKLMEKGQGLLAELQGMESCVDLDDRQVDVQAICAEIVRICCDASISLPPVSITVDGDYKSLIIPSETSTSSSSSSVPLERAVFPLLRCLLCRICQGSAATLPSLSETVLQTIQSLLLTPLREAQSALSSQSLTLFISFIETQYTSPMIIAEEIKSLAVRSPFGYKQKTVFYPTNSYAYTMWRWESLSQQEWLYFDLYRLWQKCTEAQAMPAAAVEEDKEVSSMAVESSAPVTEPMLAVVTDEHQQSFNLSILASQLGEMLSAVKAAQMLWKEAKSTRSRYGKAVQNIFKLVDLLLDHRSLFASAPAPVASSSDPSPAVPVSPEITAEEREQAILQMNNKLAVWEEKMIKSVQEVDKAKEKRREIEKKKALKAESEASKKAAQQAKEQEKLAKEREAKAAKEAKEREKEAKEREKEAKEREKEAKAREAKEKEQCKLAKQQNFFKAFLVKKEASPSSSASTPVSSTNASSKDLSGEENGQQEANLNAFVEAVRSGTFHRETSRREFYARSTAPERSNKRRRDGHAKRPRTVTIPVPVTVTKPSAQPQSGNLMEAEQTYTEITLKTFRNRQKTLLFHEDHRPAYVGTFQKRSRVIGGRRPLAKDHFVLNYDYDSEASYFSEEVSDAESIASDVRSEAEGEGGEDRLEYDGFFVRDGEGDGDAEGAMMVIGTGKEEQIGVLFLRDFATSCENSTAPGCTVNIYDGREACGYVYSRSEGLGCGAGAHREDDVQKLSSYGAVMYV